MRKLLTLSFLVLFSIQALAAERVSVKELEQRIARAQRKSDKQAEKEITGLQLAERLSHAEFLSLSHALRGKRSGAALLAIADASAFLPPPASAIAPDSAPALKHQGEILLRAGRFVDEESRRMPNFLAQRVTTRFRDAVSYPYSAQIRYYTPNTFHWLDYRTVGVRYLGGQEEELEGDRPKRKRDISQAPVGLTTWGAFGPLLEAVVGDILQSKVGWDHWERSGADRLAVFRFFVPQEKSHYTVEYCCSFDIKGTMTVFKAMPTYHGAITIDPATGHVARIVVICDLAPGQVITRADTELEYGPVEIASQTYFLPLRGVSASATPTTQHLGGIGSTYYSEDDHWSVTSINDLQFQDYRVFRAEMKILPAETPAKATD